MRILYKLANVGTWSLVIILGEINMCFETKKSFLYIHLGLEYETIIAWASYTRWLLIIAWWLLLYVLYKTFRFLIVLYKKVDDDPDQEFGDMMRFLFWGFCIFFIFYFLVWIDMLYFILEELIALLIAWGTHWYKLFQGKGGRRGGSGGF